MARLLIVDDEPGILDILADILAKEGYEMDTAASGDEALEKLRAHPPDLMLLDVRMPGAGGIEVLKEAKNMLPELAVIMVTAVYDERLARRAMELGAFGYVTKPVDLKCLKSSVAVKLIEMQKLGGSVIRASEENGVARGGSDDHPGGG